MKREWAVSFLGILLIISETHCNQSVHSIITKQANGKCSKLPFSFWLKVVFPFQWQWKEIKVVISINKWKTSSLFLLVFMESINVLRSQISVAQTCPKISKTVFAYLKPPVMVALLFSSSATLLKHFSSLLFLNCFYIKNFNHISKFPLFFRKNLTF